MNSKLRIIVTGLIAQHPSLGGVTWDYVQYPAGLARLGHDVYYFEDSGEWPYSLDGGPSGNDWVVTDPVENVGHLSRTMERFGLRDRWAYFFPTTKKWFGLSARRRREVIESADLLINVSGTLVHPKNYRAVPRLAYIDSDPVFTQVKLRMRRGHGAFQKRFHSHDLFFSFGQSPDDSNWLRTRQPVLLDQWRPGAASRDVFTTVMSWTSYKPLTFQRRRYGQKDVEFKRFLGLPRLVPGCELEIAMNGITHVNWQSTDRGLPAEIARMLAGNPGLSPADLLRRTGWRVVDAVAACGGLESYRRYIEISRGEWSVAKHGYVAGRSGWFSCRSACYLAAGRPVVVQDTGFSDVLPTGEGILAFNNLDEAADGIRRVEGDYTRHAKAARFLAEEYFDSDKVLSRLVEQAMTREVRT